MRRRRECGVCGGRFTTYEYVEERPLQVLKSGGNAEEFDRDKLLRSIRVACAKRPVSPSAIDRLVERVEDALTRDGKLEVRSARIGEIVMEALKPLDRVAYIRYASVYRNFQDIDEFQEVVEDLNARRQRELRAKHQVELPI